MHIRVEKKSLYEESQEFLPSDCLGQWQGDLPAPVTLFGNTSSVLDRAWELAAMGKLKPWASVLAKSQEQGRGQTRRLWHSPEGNVYAALRLPLVTPFTTSAASMAFSVLLIKALEKMGIFLQLKWPNDLVHKAKQEKVGGILLEERGGILLAGIGINILHAPPITALRENFALPAGILAEDLEQVLWKNGLIRKDNADFFYNFPAVESLWLQLVNSMFLCYESSLSYESTWKNEAMARLLWKNSVVQLHDGVDVVHGILQDIGALGEIGLLVDGKIQYFVNGNVRFVS